MQDSMDYRAAVRQVGELFRGRLSDEVLDDALDYVNFNEHGLALELLCDQLIEYNVSITSSEFRAIENLFDVMSLTSAHRLTGTHKLISK